MQCLFLDCFVQKQNGHRQSSAEFEGVGQVCYSLLFFVSNCFGAIAKLFEQIIVHRVAMYTIHTMYINYIIDIDTG